jgi:hypothetical protein
MTFFHDLNKRLAELASKQDLHESKVAESEKWIQKAVNPANKGNLHKALHVAQGEKIPAGKLEKATHSKNSKLRHMAQFAKNVAHEGQEMDEEVYAPGQSPQQLNRAANNAAAAQRNQPTPGVKPPPRYVKPGTAVAEEMADEGNAFSGNLAKAKAAHKSEFEVDGKTYPVKEEKKKAKPDYIDLDGDGNKKETMKKAASDKKRSTGTAFDREHMDKLRKEKEAETHGRYDVHDTGYSKRYTRKTVDTDIDKDDEVKSDEPKRKGRPKGPAKGPERTTKGAWKHKGERKTKTKEALDSDGVMMTRPTNCSSESIDPAKQGEYNDEAGMTKDSLHTIVRHAKELERALRSNENLPEWVQEKIGQIKGMMSSVTDYIISTHERDIEQHTGEEGLTTVIPEKAVSKAQRKFMGMAHAIQKGEKIKGASPELKKVAKSMKSSDTHDFAATKEKGLPEKVKAKKAESKDEVEETTVAGSVAPVANAAPKGKGGMQFGKGVYEGFNTSVERMITESMSINVNMNTGEDGQARKSITVSAEGEEADQLAALLKMAGLHGQSSESCDSCGQAPCGCNETVDEAYGDTDETLNNPDWPTDTETLAAEPNLRTYSGGLNGPKSTGQTTVPVVASQLRRQASMEESVELERTLFKTWKNYKG